MGNSLGIEEETLGGFDKVALTTICVTYAVFIGMIWYLFLQNAHVVTERNIARVRANRAEETATDAEAQLVLARQASNRSAATPSQSGPSRDVAQPPAASGNDAGLQPFGNAANRAAIPAEKLRQELATAETQLRALQREHGDTEAELNKAREEVVQLQSQRNDLEKANAALAKQRADAQRRIDDLATQLAAARKAVEAAERRAADAETAAREARQSLMAAVKAKAQAVEDLQKTIASQRAEIKRLRNPDGDAAETPVQARKPAPSDS